MREHCYFFGQQSGYAGHYECGLCWSDINDPS